MGGVIDLDGGYGGVDVCWVWYGDWVGWLLDVVIGVNVDC